MPFGSKKGKTAASNNKQLCLGLPDILIAAVARHYGLQEREAAAGIDDDGGAAGEPARVNQHDAQATAARDAALLEATEECIAYLGANPSFVDRVTNRLRLNSGASRRARAVLTPAINLRHDASNAPRRLAEDRSQAAGRAQEANRRRVALGVVSLSLAAAQGQM